VFNATRLRDCNLFVGISQDQFQANAGCNRLPQQFSAIVSANGCGNDRTIV